MDNPTPLRFQTFAPWNRCAHVRNRRESPEAASNSITCATPPDSITPAACESSSHTGCGVSYLVGLVTRIRVADAIKWRTAPDPKEQRTEPIKRLTGILALLSLIILAALIPPAQAASKDKRGGTKASPSAPATTTPISEPTATAEPTTTAALASTSPGYIGPSYFGGHILGLLEKNIQGTGIATAWPQEKPTTHRLWNTYGYNPVKKKYEGISWNNINTAPGVYDWALFDAVLDKHKAMGSTDLLYTFGYTPPWAAGGSTTYDKAPTSYTYLYNFARAIAKRAVDRGVPIRNWEVWNEPNNGAGTWTGTHAQMVQMAKAIRSGVKSVDPSFNVLTPSPQGNSTVWMNGYLAAGGGAYADTMAFHGYTSGTPETILSLINNYKKVFAAYGQSGKRIWDTEAMDLRTSDPALQGRFLAINYLLHKSAGVDRLYWYAYDADQGRLWDHTSGLNAAGKAKLQVHAWMVGATVGTIGVSGSVYSVPLTKDGKTFKAVWNAGGSTSYATGGYTRYTTLRGYTAATNGKITIGKDPVLLSY